MAQRSCATTLTASLDASFGTGGIATIAFGSVQGIALQSDGKIVLSGEQSPTGGGDAFMIARLNANGAVDSAFGSSGRVAIGTLNGVARSVTVQADGKIVAGGFAQSATALVRVDSTGALDNTFGSSGVALVHVSPNAETMQGMAATADGRFVLAGFVPDTAHGTDDEIIARFTSTGALDTTFNATGFHQVDAGSMPAAAKATVLQADGKIVVTGYVQSEASPHPTIPDSLLLARYNTDGSLDTSFGVAGYAMPANTAQANAVALQADGKIVTAGFQNGGSSKLVQVARFNTSGALDTSFGSGGLVNLSVNGVDDEATGVAIQGDGKIVVGGFTKNGTFTDALAIRLTATGALDPSFLGGEVAVQMSTGNDQANGIALQPDGKIVLAGSAEVTGGNDAFAAARLNTDGTLDSGFGTGGVVNTIIGSFLSDGFAVAIQGDGKIVVGGLTFNGTTDDFAVVRYATDGTLDTTFGSGGKAVNDLGNHNRIFALQTLADGKIAVAGEWAGAFTAGLYDANGTLDSTFGTGGAVFLPVNFNAGADHAFSLAIQPDGKWVLAGDGSGLFAWARLLGEAGGATITVNPTVALASSANPSTSGQNVTFTATVSGSAGTATGTVNFMDGGTSLAGCSAAALSSGTATCSTAALIDGPHSITADYSGDAAYNAGTSNTVTQTVQANPVLAVAKAGSGTGTVTSSPAGINCGATCSAPFAAATVVSLSAAGDSGSTFAGWSGGGCSGTGACSVTLNAATTVTATFSSAADSPRLGAISTRMDVLTGDNVMIGGFVIQGSTPKTVVIRARGPSLGVANFLANPVLNLVFSNGTVITNDDWQSAPNAADIQASGFQPGDPRESAIMMTLDPGAYTAIVTGAGGTTGVGIVEVFEVDHPENPLAGISTRGFVQTGDNVLIGGIVVQGSAPRRVIVRARGPSLAGAGVANTARQPDAHAGALLRRRGDRHQRRLAERAQRRRHPGERHAAGRPARVRDPDHARPGRLHRHRLRRGRHQRRGHRGGFPGAVTARRSRA